MKSISQCKYVLINKAIYMKDSQANSRMWSLMLSMKALVEENRGH